MKYLIAAVLLIATFAHADDNVCTMSVEAAAARVRAESFRTLLDDEEKADSCFQSSSDKLLMDSSYVMHLGVLMLIYQEEKNRMMQFLLDAKISHNFSTYDAAVKR